MTALLYVAISLAIASLFGNAWVAVKVWSTWPALDRDERQVGLGVLAATTAAIALTIAAGAGLPRMLS